MKTNLRSWIMNLAPKAIQKWLRLIWIVWFSGEYERESSKIISEIIQPGWTCVDVGANVGIIARRIAKIVGPTGRVIAFEASSDNARIFSRANELAGLASRIIVENMAISDGTHSELLLYPGRGSASEEWNIVGQDLDGNKQEAAYRIPATSLDRYFPSGTAVHFIKIDIEGAEALALRGMTRILQTSRPILFIEFHNEDGWSGRKELYEAKYGLYDMQGRKVDPNNDKERIYHCLAFPTEKRTNTIRK
jgi:FkbM family methyltransferase